MALTPIKKFFDKGLEADLAEHLIPSGCFISGNDFRIGITDKGGEGYIENILKTAEKFHTLPSSGTNIRIGFAADDENGFIVKFNWNSNSDHGIYLYDIVNDLWYTVLLSDDVTGGLNFNKYSLINGAFIINGILYWNDFLNEPRSLHLGAFISAYGASPLPSPVETDFVPTLPVDYTEITLIKKGPTFPPGITKLENTSFNNNFIGNDSFQFAVRWRHFTGDVSVMSGWSAASFLNNPNEDFNHISVSLDGREIMPYGVRFIELIVRAASSLDKGFVVKSWDRLIASDEALIDTQTLLFDFYNNVTGEAVDSVSFARAFYTVPLLSGSMTAGKNRIILGDNTEGYDTPLTTSLAFSLTSQASTGVSSVVKNLMEIRAKVGVAGPDNDYGYGGWYVYLTESGTPGYYLVNGTEKTAILNDNSWPYNPALDPPPTSATSSTLTFIGDTKADVELYIKGVNQVEGIAFYTRPQTISILGLTVTVYNVLKSNSTYRVGIVFYDRYLRKCGVVFNDDIVSIPKRNFNLTTLYTSINWSLGYSNSLAEIPEWAYYYSVVRTLNLRTRYFVQSYDDAVKYAIRDSDGLLTFTSTTYSISTVAVAINSSALLQANLGWVYSEGDQCILIDNSNNVYELPVIGQEGEYILLKPVNVGDVTGKTFSYELYVPYKASDQEPFYEMGEMFRITDPGTVSRTYETLSGVFRYDAFAFTRNYNAVTYFAEAMNPNDTYFQRWDTDAGRGTRITKLGQNRYETGIRFSNVIIDETQTNGLSAFEALNREILPQDLGTITKLIGATKVQKQGTVLLAICEQEVSSIYLGETEVFDAQGNSFLAKSDKFIGQVNVLQGGFGSSNHESVVPLKGLVYWYSKVKGSFVAYSNNGVFPISENGMKRVSNLFSQKYATLSVSQIEALGSRPFVFGGVDPYHDEVYFSIPATESTPPKGFLADYISPDLPVIYPYDIYDGTAKVLVYQVRQDRWGAPHKYQTEGFIDIRDLTYSAKNGALHKHNVDDGTSETYSRWYGESVQPGIGFIVNEEPNIVKQYLTLSIEGNLIQPSWIHHRTEYPNTQSTDCEEFKIREGVLYEKYGILRDRLSPNVSGTFDAKLFTGDRMRGQWLKVFVQFTTNELLQIRFFTVGAIKDSGQLT